MLRLLHVYFLTVIRVTSIFRGPNPNAPVTDFHQARLRSNDLNAVLHDQRLSLPFSRVVVRITIDILAALHALSAGFPPWLIYDL